ncbi:NHL repeat-containing protein [Emticicia soli]|uniref:Beta-propeller repeat protein n=1 Tax=Emticicia soli TaxID=2027878 RepID=A0ABW5JEV0_9BACT
MLKKTLLIALAIFCQFSLWGQGAQTTPTGTLIANQNAAAAMPASALLELRSTNKGMLPPRMTTAQINAIASPATGLMAYDTDLKCLKTYNGSQWACANANIVASTPLSSSFAFKAATNSYMLGESIIADNAGNQIAVGSFYGAITFGSTSNSRTLTSLGDYDGFIVKHDKNGSLLWATQIGGSGGNQEILDIALDNTGNIAVTGYLRYATNFYSTNGGESAYTTSSSYEQIFVAKYNSSGVLIWYKVFSSGGNFHSRGKGVTFDSAGNILSTGNYRGTVAFDGFSLSSTSGTDDIFTAKHNAANGNIIWVKTAGSGNNGESGFELVCDASNNVYVLGHYAGTAMFGESPNTVTFTSRGDIDIFVMKYTASGDFTWAKTAGSVVEESMGGITYSAAANAIYICGSYKNALSFGPGLGTNSLTTVGSTSYFNGFLAKYDLNGNILWATRHGNTSSYHNFSGDIDVDANGNPYITGTLQYDSWFYSVNSSDNFYVRGVQYGEPFIAKYNAAGALQWVVSAIDGYDESTRGISVKNNVAYTIGNFKETINFGYQQVHSTNNSYYGDLFIWRYQE